MFGKTEKDDIVVQSPTFEMLAEIFDRAGVNYSETAIRHIEPIMLEFLTEFTQVMLSNIPQHLHMGLLDGMKMDPINTLVSLRMRKSKR